MTLPEAPVLAPEAVRWQIQVEGAVQGVGFRPTVYRLATELGLAGWVTNTLQGVVVEVEGMPEVLEEFVLRLQHEAPPLASILALHAEPVGVLGERSFAIRPSASDGARRALILPDAAICPACLADIRDPANRRYGYPFTNCTHCGPRFSIIEALPYDRLHTTMRDFALCPECRCEYEDPDDRRFHAQPNACPACGPHVEFHARGAHGWARTATHKGAIPAAAAALRAGQIVAVKGLGGFHLLCDAANPASVKALRERKGREEKPLALMALDLAQARTLIEPNPSEETALASAAAPIVVGTRRPGSAVAGEVAPGNPTLGVMIAYTPLHWLLLCETGRPVVATSGNLSDEPICTGNDEAVERLGGIADAFLLHNRPIARPIDDSVVRVMAGAPRFVRRSRGYAPAPVRIGQDGPPLLAVGGHLKNVIALAVGRDVFLSQHVGDLETPQALAAFARVIDDFARMYDVQPTALVHDLHPDYASTQWAAQQARGAGAPCLAVQHHHAHLAACLADNGVEGPALGVIWDGSGYGGDGSVWGGEFLVGSASGAARAAHLRTFRLPGGETAVRQPRRCALALLWEIGADTATLADFGAGERHVLEQMLARGVSSPVTSSAGRLFDALAALAGIRTRAHFEGQAAMEFEAATDLTERGAYPLALSGDGSILDWEPLVQALLDDRARGVPAGIVAARCHRGLAAAIVAVAQSVGQTRVALSGGCFQNRLLTEWTANALRAAGFEVLLHRQVPANDGGLCLGQIAVARAAANPVSAC